MDKTQSLLLLHCIITAILIILYGYLLHRRRLLNWTTYGFWSLLAITLFYFINPLASLITGNLFSYSLSINLSDGNQRIIWILANICVGTISFFIVYIRTKPNLITFSLRNNYQQITIPMFFVMLIIYLFAFYSLLIYRSFIMLINREIIIREGRFVGETTGYEYVAFMFLFVPIALLLLSNSPIRRGLGWLSAILFVWLSLPNGWVRFAIVSMIIALSIIDAIRNKSKNPKLFWMLLIIIFGLALQIRGHESWSLFKIDKQLIDSIAQIPNRITTALASVDANMLPSWYLESYVKDRITGFDYGLPIVNYILSGWIPSRILPEKYFIIDWLAQTQPEIYSPSITNNLMGAKSTLMGSFYGHGGIIAVILLMGLMGYLFRKLDGMLMDESPILIKALGVSWLSVLWMVWGSHDWWGLSIFGILAIPALALWIASPKQRGFRKTEAMVEDNPSGIKESIASSKYI